MITTIPDRERTLQAEVDRLTAENARLRAVEPVAWMDDFGNAFPLAANKGAGSWMDEHKRHWKPLYRAAPPAQPAEPVQRLSDERAAFEAWHNEYRTQELVRRDDTYYNTHVRCRWEGWQARAIESALQPGWRDIESAPKDELILVGPTKRMGICVAMHDSRDGWVTETCSEWMTIYTPTHWMPIPPAPKATK